MTTAKPLRPAKTRRVRATWSLAAVVGVFSFLALAVGVTVLTVDATFHHRAAAPTASAPPPARGVVWTWGANEYGQLGDRSLTMAMSRTRVHDLAGFEHRLPGPDVVAGRAGGHELGLLPHHVELLALLVEGQSRRAELFREGSAAPDNVNRRATSQSGENDSRPMRMARYVEPQIK